MSYREGRFWQPDVTVATVVVAEGRLLCVEERADGRLVINQPAGHLEPDESLAEAALREPRRWRAPGAIRVDDAALATQQGDRLSAGGTIRSDSLNAISVRSSFARSS